MDYSLIAVNMGFGARGPSEEFGKNEIFPSFIFFPPGKSPPQIGTLTQQLYVSLIYCLRSFILPPGSAAAHTTASESHIRADLSVPRRPSARPPDPKSLMRRPLLNTKKGRTRNFDSSFANAIILNFKYRRLRQVPLIEKLCRPRLRAAPDNNYNY